MTASRPSRAPSALALLALGLARRGLRHAGRHADDAAGRARTALLAARSGRRRSHGGRARGGGARRGSAARPRSRCAGCRRSTPCSWPPTSRATGLAPVSHDLVNATLDGGRAYRSATLELLERDDLDPATHERLSQAALDDPLVLANARIRDARMIEFGRAFNALAEPIAKSMLTLTLAPYRLARSVVEYSVALWQQDALPLQRRQALAHWKEFIARYPDAPEVAELQPKVEAAEAQLRATQRDQALRVADRALARGDVRTALVFSDRALRIMPEDPASLERRDEAAAGLLALRANQQRSLEAAPAARRRRPMRGRSPSRCCCPRGRSKRPRASCSRATPTARSRTKRASRSRSRTARPARKTACGTSSRRSSARGSVAVEHGAPRRRARVRPEAQRLGRLPRGALARPPQPRAVGAGRARSTPACATATCPSRSSGCFEAPSIAQSMMSSPVAPAPAALARRDAVDAGGRRRGARLPRAPSERRARRRRARVARSTTRGSASNWIGALSVAQTRAGRGPRGAGTPAQARCGAGARRVVARGESRACASACCA